MGPTTRYYIILVIGITAYFFTSKYIFNKLNSTTHTVIDEYFHIPQGLLYCNGNFSHGDRTITTLPGLYLVSVIVGTYFKCNNLRFVNLIASCINLLLFCSILKYMYYYVRSQTKILIQALSLSILPPLYFFSHICYTDTLSLSFLLLFSRVCFTNRHTFFILVFGLCSVLMRQTNVVWVSLIFGHKFLYIFIRSSRVLGNHYLTGVKLSKWSLIAKYVDSSKLKRYYGVRDVYYAVKYHLSTRFATFLRLLTFQDAAILRTHLLILISFVTFVYYNRSIVVGDKTADEATIHTPQLLYFFIFYGVLGLPFVLSKLLSTLKLIFRNKLLAIIIAGVFAVMVHYNTRVYPYLLADNRHFTFYIWDRWYGKHDFAMYASIPVYIFLVFSLYDNLREHNCISFFLPYIVSLILILPLQELIDIRYFLIPYIVLRLRFGRPSNLVIFSEFLWYVLLNTGAFYVFFNTVYSKDFDYAQRIL